MSRENTNPYSHRKVKQIVIWLSRKTCLDKKENN